MIRTGSDRLLDESKVLAGRRYGLLGHAASITGACQATHMALAASPGGAPAALFGPEHGYYGVEQYMEASDDQVDPLTGVPILSLYGDTVESLRPQPEAFAGLDLLLIDLQDVGSRYYTYAATAVWAAEVALEAGLEVWVLDRPNPLGGEVVEGDLPRPGYDSFVGAFEIPVRHGLTLGELVRLEASRRGWRDGLDVWTMDGWRRSMFWAETGLPWVAPSPNMPTVRTTQVYPGGCLFEATGVSEGRGTTQPFQQIGAPGIDVGTLLRHLEALALPGVRFLPAYFRPQFEKHAGEVCAGVRLHVTSPESFPAYRCGVEILAVLHDHFADPFEWRREPYEFVSDRPAIDLLTGGPELRSALESGRGTQDWVESWGADEARFRQERLGVLLYS
ncbi:MAG: DUF1343 domain-containing protein [Acidobacteriota bacterium]